jgi:four helix bundle protein
MCYGKTSSGEDERKMITSYRELNVWQKADDLAYRIYDLTEKYPKAYQYNLTDQLRRAALSIPTNIAEGCASVHSKEFLQYLNIARRSLSETEYLLHFSDRRGLVPTEEMNELRQLIVLISKMINGLIKSIKNKK